MKGIKCEGMSRKEEFEVLGDLERSFQVCPNEARNYLQFHRGVATVAVVHFIGIY